MPDILNRDVIDEVAAVTEEQAVRAQLQLARREGIAAGMSSGAALHVALTIAQRPGMKGKRVVVILPDGGERSRPTRSSPKSLARWMQANDRGVRNAHP